MFASAPARSTPLPRKCFRPCGSNLAGTWKRERAREAPRKRSPHSHVGAAPVGRSTQGPSQTTARSRRFIKKFTGLFHGSSSGKGFCICAQGRQAGRSLRDGHLRGGGRLDRSLADSRALQLVASRLAVERLRRAWGCAGEVKRRGIP